MWFLMFYLAAGITFCIVVLTLIAMRSIKFQEPYSIPALIGYCVLLWPLAIIELYT